MKTRLITISLAFILVSLVLVSAGNKVTNVPDDMTREEFMQKISQANRQNLFGILSISGENWRVCEQQCSNLIFHSQCNPCQSGEVASNIMVCGDSKGCVDPYSSGQSYCDDWTAQYDYFNVMALCTTPSTECSGGYEEGERKCEGSDLYECDDTGTWDYIENCDYGCSNAQCEDQNCISHDKRECYNGDIYWYDSCGEREGKEEDCSSDEVCENADCVRVCEEKYIGEQICQGENVVRKYQSEDCSTEWKTIENCDYDCDNGACIDPSCPTPAPEPGVWSNCQNGIMTRTNFKCDETTDYDWRTYTEEKNCGCSSDGQCNEDEVCNDYTCEPLNCDENQIASNHECIDKKTNLGILIGIIAVPIILIILIGGIIYFIFRR